MYRGCAVMFRAFATSVLLFAGSAVALGAQSVGITEDAAEIQFTVNGATAKIARVQDTANTIDPAYALTSRPCPENCITPMQAAPGVATIGELEVLDFLQAAVSADAGLLLDVRSTGAYQAATIPGAVNVPGATLEDDNPFRAEILKAFGATQSGEELSFEKAKVLTVFGDGPWSGEAASVVGSLVEAGYPVEKINYYRGGMQLWLLFGLTVATP